MSDEQPTQLEQEVLRLKFDAIAPRCDGIANTDDGRFFTAGVIPGEEAVIRIRKRRRNWVATDLVEITEPSPHRVVPRCPLFQTCSGCQLQHVAYPHQLELKRAIVAEQLQYFGDFDDPPIAETIGAPDPWHYRNHARFTVKDGALGFVRRFRREFLKIPQCFIMNRRIGEVLGAFQDGLHGATQCNIRVGTRTGAMMIQPRLDVTHLEHQFESGQTMLEEEVGGRRFRISAASFFQVHTAMAERMIEVVREALRLQPDHVLVDAYAGVGSFAILLAPDVQRVIAIEESGPAIADARHNAALSPAAENITWHQGKTEEVLPQVAGPIDALILDPPRSGCAPAALQAVLTLAPRRVAYVSCDAATLAKDLRHLCDAGYVLDVVQPLDMFPHTHHIECVAVLSKP